MAKKDKDNLRPAVPQPTKRDMVIAQRQAQVAEGDSILSISKKNNLPAEELLAANPGVVTVRPGQVIALPKTGGGNMYSPTPVTNPFAGAGAKVGVGTVGGQPNLGNYNTSYNGFQTPTTNGFKAPTPYAGYTGTAGYGMQGKPLTPSQVNFQTPTTNGFQAPQQPYLGASSYLNPALKPQEQTTQNTIPQRPTGTYTGDPQDPNTALWKARWDWEARNPIQARDQAIALGLQAAPTVMTRDQIWQMKADQRRRQAASAEQDGTQYNQPAYQYDTRADGSNAPLVRNIIWGI